jgi:formylglycine-generating enzyme required for sulfatase activity
MEALILVEKEQTVDRRTMESVLGEIQPVGSYPDFASPYGALDMAGNLWEWVADVYPGTTDYMLKGGDWETLAWGVRSAVRGGKWEVKGKLLWGSSWDDWYYSYR